MLNMLRQSIKADGKSIYKVTVIQVFVNNYYTTTSKQK